MLVDLSDAEREAFMTGKEVPLPMHLCNLLAEEKSRS